MENIDKIIEDILYKCENSMGCYWVLSTLILMSIGEDKDAEMLTVFSLIEGKIKSEELLGEYPAGYTVNSKTIDINKKGGYIKYTANLNKISQLREQGQTARDREDIRKYKYMTWVALFLSITAIVLSILALIL